MMQDSHSLMQGSRRYSILMIRKLVISLMLAVAAFAVTQASAQRNDNLYTVEVGGARDISTYLSPLYYHGADYGLAGLWSRPFGPLRERVRMGFEADLHFRNMLNPAGSARMLGATARFGWGLHAVWDFTERWTVSAGGAVDLYGGALWLLRNGNNPVSAIASVGLDLTASVSYRFRMGRLPVTIDDRVSLPTLSAFFCPEYGESYYEIYLGNRHGLVHCGWWGNAPGVNNLLTFSLHFGSRALVLGYRLNLRTFAANHLDTRLLTNAFVIGWSL